ncbi:MAG: RluA family pseudouridine synthase [Bacillota bacterium]|nr:RluA family pseudouridine synthase [Bacillota bacterium]
MKLAAYDYAYVEFFVDLDQGLFEFLKGQGLSERFIKGSYRKSLIKINNKEPKFPFQLYKNDLVRIYYEDQTPRTQACSYADLDIVYENENFLLLNKAPGISVHPTFSRQKNTLLDKLGSYFKDQQIHRPVRLVNRLDLETSGLILVAKNPLFQDQVSRDFGSGLVEKSYLALVQGNFKEKILLEKEILDQEDFKMKRIVDPRGKMAITSLVPLKSTESYSLVQAQPLTGRSHQIRVHLAYLGHPILADQLYGKNSDLISRCALHSHSLSFVDPFSKERKSFKAKVPADMEVLIKGLGLKI